MKVRYIDCLTFTECLELSIDSLDQEPVSHERYVLVEVLNIHLNIAAATTQLNVWKARQHKVQAKIGNSASVQIQSFDLLK